MRRNILILLLSGCLLTSCIHEGTLVNNPAPLMNYQNKPTEAKLLTVAKGYAEAINQNLKNNAIHPGLYADYGVALAKLGCLSQANTMFNNEMFLFPNSTLYVTFLKQTLTPNESANTLCDTSAINLKTLDTIQVTLTPDELALQQELEKDPEYQRMLKQQQKEEKEQRTLEIKKAKKEQAKAKEAEQKAKAKAKEQEKIAKEKAKKEAQKAKEQEKKAAAKAKKEAEKAKKAEAKAKQKEANNN